MCDVLEDFTPDVWSDRDLVTLEAASTSWALCLVLRAVPEQFWWCDGGTLFSCWSVTVFRRYMYRRFLNKTLHCSEVMSVIHSIWLHLMFVDKVLFLLVGVLIVEVIVCLKSEIKYLLKHHQGLLMALRQQTRNHDDDDDDDNAVCEWRLLFPATTPEFDCRKSFYKL